LTFDAAYFKYGLGKLFMTFKFVRYHYGFVKYHQLVRSTPYGLFQNLGLILYQLMEGFFVL